MQLKRPISSKEAAKILGVNVSTIKRWTDSGLLACQRTAGGHRKILPEHLFAFLAQQKNKGASFILNGENEKDVELWFHAIDGNFDTLRELIVKEALAGNTNRIVFFLTMLLNIPTPLHRIFDDYMTPIMHTLGDMWQNEKISVQEEHIASQTIKSAILRFSSIIQFPDKKEGIALCSNLEGELHDIALHFVALLLEKRGFQVVFSGQTTPLATIQPLWSIYEFDRLYISTTIVHDAVSLRKNLVHIFAEASQLGVDVFIGGQGLASLNLGEEPGVRKLFNFQQVYEI